MNEAELIRRAMSALGKRTSERKKISSRKNAKRPRKKKVEVVLVPVQPKDTNIVYSGETAIVYVDPNQFPKA